MTRLFLNNNPKTILFCLGCISALAMAPIYAWPLMMLGYCALIHYLVKARGWKITAQYTFCFFLGYFLTGLYWISSSLLVDISTWWWALPLSFLGLPVALSLFPAIIVPMGGWVEKFKPALLIIGLIIADIARGHIFTGFPWNLPAHTWTHTDIMMATLPYIGFWGLNSLTIIIFCMPAFFPKATIKLGFFCLIIALSFTPIQINRINKTNALPNNIHMIQANIPQNQKWNPNLVWRNFSRYTQLSQNVVHNDESQIIIWPETAISEFFINQPDSLTEFKSFLSSLPKRSILITGYLHYIDGEPYNSLAIFNRNAEIIKIYSKHHLVPFGEYMPFGFDTITGFRNFSAGPPPQPMRLNEFNLTLHPVICYEIIFSRYLSNITDNAVILNITNDAWFGNTAGPYQHFDHAIFRSVENKSYGLRLSGNGLSGVISPQGGLVNLSNLNEVATLSNN